VPPDAHFWREAIQAVRAVHPDFVFMAEVYWDREFELQQEGFDFTYDKSLYDRLRSGDGHSVREHLLADQEFQRRSVRFLENHDEPRAAATFSPPVHQAAAVVAFLAPGLRFFHEGEFQGRRVRVSMHVRRRPEEQVDAEIEAFYERLLRVLDLDVVHSGEWCLHVCRPAWPGNESWRDIIVTTWVRDEEQVISVVNYAPHASQCYVTLPLPQLAGRTFELVDQLGDASYRREGDGLAGDGLYLDLPPWGYHVFELRPLP
jgi:hypothetical protein